MGGSCAGTSIKAEKTPLDLFIMLDQSGSMGDAAGTGTKWEAVTSALDGFVDDPGATGLGVGIQYFGLPPAGGMTCPTQCMTNTDCGACGPCMGFGGFGFCQGAGGNDSCFPPDYSMAEVEIAALPGNAAMLKSSIGNHGPSTGTPTKPALQGAIVHSKMWAKSHPGHAVVVVFATDGEPSSGCDDDIGHIEDVAATGYNVAPSIRTFVIGVGSNLDNLNGIAAAGGTQQAFLVDASANTTQQFLDALHTIQGTVLPCQYLIPVPQSGTPDFNSVNVDYTPGGAGAPNHIPHVNDLAHCPPSGDAWYYDDPSAPTTILLCPSTCQTVSGDIDGKVDVVLGCATIPA